MIVSKTGFIIMMIMMMMIFFYKHYLFGLINREINPYMKTSPDDDDKKIRHHKGHNLCHK